MTLPRLYAMTSYWREHPPAHQSLNGLIRALTVREGKGKTFKRGEPAGPRPTNGGPRYVPTAHPVDARGNPTRESPKSVEQAAVMLADKGLGRIIRFKRVSPIADGVL